VAGYSDWSGALVTLQYWGRSGWVNWKQTTSASTGYYGFRVPAGWSYQFFVSSVLSLPMTFPGVGTFLCRQTWADYSNWVTARKGRNYTSLNTTLQPVGEMSC
jgi:hypothetical protein